MLKALQKKTVVEWLCNRNCEGEVKAGNVLKIATVNNPTVSDYTKGGTISYEEITGTDQDLEIDQQKYFAFKTDDITKVQSNVDLLEATTEGAGYALADTMDQFLADLIADDGTDKSITADDYLDCIAQIAKVFDDAKAPDAGRWLVVSTDFAKDLILELAGKMTNNVNIITSGYVGSIFGVNIYKSANVIKPLFGHIDAITVANQISETENIRLQDTFATGIRGLHVYGAKVTRPTLCGEITATIGE